MHHEYCTSNAAAWITFHCLGQQESEVLVCRSLIKKVCTFCSLSNPILFRCQLGKKLKQIRKNIDEIAKDRSSFLFTVPSERVGKGVLLKREQSVSDVSSEVIGREDDKEAIIKLLLSSNEKKNVTIIPIVGMAGLGKTTLAQLVFNDDRVASHFEYRQIWMSVSDDFNLRSISQRIAEKLNHENYGHLDLDLLQNLLKQKLSTSKYLLVLDDVWNGDRVKWFRLKDLLMNSARGSKVLVTTRARKIASMMATGTHNVYNLRGLPYDKYVNELLSMSLQEEEIKDHDDEARHCKIHDIIHDLAQLVGGTECSIITTHPKFSNEKFREKIRHVSVFRSVLPENFTSKIKVQISEFLCNTKKLRTLYSLLPVERKETVIDLLANLKYLRILILSESEFDGLPSSIGSLLHLRYLDLSMNRLIRRLPRSICKLQNLQTLRLYACVQLEELPKDTWKIATLRHLEITSKQDFLPKKGIECLTSLRSLSIHKCYRLSSLVQGMQHWTALQKLSLTDCPRLSSLEFDLNSLISLETLEICNCSVLDLSGRLKRKDEDSLKGRRSLLSLIAGVNYRKEDKREQNEGGEKKEEGQQGLQKLRSLTFVQLPKLIELPYELKNAASSLQYLADELKELVQKKTLYRANTVDLDVLTEERLNLNEF
ncbi:hypothetical protein DKX38_027369 [Salix brachista]|uniref:Uncharacterized protein n=1 Tax=Salix brachista TaxID=2182728 RepID=A0A5N5JBZ7_9ROSI|nr:hypothetical protein DKX38_027369 [Salix brachista]